MTDPKGMLVSTFMDWVIALRPRFFLMENVPPLAKLNDGETLRLLCGKAAAAGYAVSHSILNAADYGAPTNRRRLIVIGVLGEVPFRFPDSTHSNDADLLSKQPYVTSGQALAGLPKFGWSAPGVPQGHLGIRHTPSVAARFAGLKQGQQDNIRKRTRLHLDRPAPTLVAGNLKGIRSHIHPTEPRELTNRESARLHGFDDEFEFAGNHSAIGKQIANSVPIALARALGNSLAEYLDAQRMKNQS
jgi:DNA (cytosine-5)-methyltransferase 1